MAKQKTAQKKQTQTGPTREELGAGHPAKNPKNPKTPKTPGVAASPSTPTFASIWKFPAATVRTVPVASLTFDKRLQHRGKITDPDTVADYAERMRETRKDDPESPNGGAPNLKAVTDGTNTWVYDGFQRGAALTEAKIEEARLDVTPGTFEDALFLSLSSNAEHGLSRNRDDKRRSVWSLIDNPEAMKFVSDKADGNGGLHRVIAAACGVSRGTVEKALTARGLRVSGLKITKRPEGKEENPVIPGTTAADDALKTDPDARTSAAPDPQAQKRANDAAFAEMRQRKTGDNVSDGSRHCRKMATTVAAALGDVNHAAKLIELSEKHGFPIDRKILASFQDKEAAPYLDILECWPLVAKLAEMFLEMRRTVEGAATPAPWETKTIPGTTTEPPKDAPATTTIDAPTTPEVAAVATGKKPRGKGQKSTEGEPQAQK